MTEKIQQFTLEYILCDDFTILKDLQYKSKQAAMYQYGGKEFEGENGISDIRFKLYLYFLSQNLNIK